MCIRDSKNPLESGFRLDDKNFSKLHISRVKKNIVIKIPRGEQGLFWPIVYWKFYTADNSDTSQHHENCNTLFLFREEADQLAKKLKVRFYRTSVKEDLNVNEGIYFMNTH